jgi:hypothetical protein
MWHMPDIYEQYKPPSLLGTELRPMTEEESRYFLQCSLHPDFRTAVDQGFADQAGFSGKVMFARCKHHGIEIERGLFLFLCVTSNTPAKLVMWVWTLHNAKSTGYLSGMATLETWGMRLFPNGMPTEEAFEKIWDAQKSEKGGNLLDGDTVWKL